MRKRPMNDLIEHIDKLHTTERGVGRIKRNLSVDADDVVPYAENGAKLARRYRELGGVVEVILKPGVGHHPHSLEDPRPIVDFILGVSNE